MVRRASLLAAVLLAAVTALVAGTARAESNGGVRVMPLGDSITDGLVVPGGYRIDLWQKLVAGGFRVDFVGSLANGPASLGDHDHEGHSGWRIDQIDASLVNWLRATTPRTILLHIGTNDMIQNPAGAPARLSTLLDHIATNAPAADVFVATIIPLSGGDANVRTFNAAVPGIVQSHGSRFHLVDMFSALTTADLQDGVHPNAGGYSKMATVWFNALRSVPGSLGDGSSSTPASPSASRSASAPASASGGTGACTASYKLISNWNSGFQGEVTVTGRAALNGWTVRLTLAGGQSINNLWGGVNTGTSGAISVRNADYNRSVPAGGSATFGFVGNGNGATPPSGLACTSP